MNWSELNYFADENIAPEITDFLRANNYIVKTVIEENLQGKDDEYLLSYAFKEKRVIITHDSDFGKIVFTKQVNFTGIIYLRPGHFNPEFTLTTLKTLFSQDLELKTPFIIVAENCIDKIKIRIREY